MRDTVIIWFRRDLRLADHAALTAAVERGDAVIPVFIPAPEEEGDWPPGAASRWWLHHSLSRLDESLQSLGAKLILRSGPSLDVLRDLVRETGAKSVFWHRRYEPAGMAADARIRTALQGDGIEVEQFGGDVLFEPESVQTQSGGFYQVFTPYWKACMALPEPTAPEDPPKVLSVPDRWPDSLSLNQLSLLPDIDWASGIRSVWQPGSEGAAAQLDRFIDKAIAAYEDHRDRPDMTGTSCLSPHLHFGEISIRQVWHAVKQRAPEAGEVYLRQLGWRDFAVHLLFHAPDTTNAPLRPEFDAFPWREDDVQLRAWQQGRTGYPLVDAGMRELWATGWMHNRVRMVVASFLVKHLRISWLEGARWFWDTLVDADLANNTLGWQWTAGCGADAAPYFRIFNPVLQSKKFDPDGTYIRRWIPEIAGLSDAQIHTPWEVSDGDLKAADIVLGKTYPMPVVDHRTAREKALNAYHQMQDRSKSS